METWITRMFNGKRYLEPLCNESEMKLANFKVNQPVKGKVTGTTKKRSLQQLRLYWKLCTVVAENTNEEGYCTKELVDRRIRIALHFIDEKLTVVRGETVYFKYRSISFQNLKHAEATDFFNRAFKLMADYLSVDIDVLIEEGLNA